MQLEAVVTLRSFNRLKALSDEKLVPPGHDAAVDVPLPFDNVFPHSFGTVLSGLIAEMNAYGASQRFEI